MRRFAASTSLVSALLVSASLGLASSCGGGGRSSGSGDGTGEGPDGEGPSGAAVSAETSSLQASTDFGIRADGLSPVELTVTVRDADGVPLAGHTVELFASGSGNLFEQPVGTSDGDGVLRGTLASSVAEIKTITAVVNPGDAGVELEGSATTEFVLVIPGSFFVRMGGDDNAAGDSPAHAWRSIGRALTAVGAGDTLYVGAGTYPESLTVSVAAPADEPLMLIADTDGTFTGDGGEVMIDAGGANWAWRFQDSTNVLLSGFCATNAIQSGAGGGIWIDGASNANVSLLGNQVFDCGIGVFVFGAQGVVLENNLITNQQGDSADGVSVAGGAQVVLANNLIYNNARHGLRVFGAGSDVRAEFNTFYANGGDQVRVQGVGSQVSVEANVVSHGGARGLHFDAGSSATETHNVVFGHSSVAFENNAGGVLAGSSNASDPLFVNPAGADGLLGGAQAADDLFVVDAASAVIDAGNGTATAAQLVFGGPLSGYSSRLDGVLDGQGDDGDTVNAGYHYRAQVDPFSSLAAGNARVFFGRTGEVQAISREFRSGDASWQSESKVEPANATIRWVVNRVSPVSPSEEILAILTDDGTSTNLFLRRWDGKVWEEANVFQPAYGGLASSDSAQRGFDVEYEQQSGDGLVVIADGDKSPRFRTLVGGAWSKEQPVFAFDATPEKVLWVELVASPVSDEITMLCVDDSARLMAAVWDGMEWINGDQPIFLDDQISEIRSTRAFDAAYESLSGDLLVAWGFSVFAEETRYATKRGGSHEFAVSQVHSSDAVGTITRLAADPASDHIVCALGEGDSDDDVVGMMWDGDAWGHIAELDASAAAGSKDLAVGWVGDSGSAVLLYRDDDGGDSLDWAQWTSGGWKLRPDAALPIGDPVSFAVADLAQVGGQSDGLLVLLRNDAGDLIPLLFDGAQWSLSNGGVALGTDVAGHGAAEAFSLTVR